MLRSNTDALPSHSCRPTHACSKHSLSLFPPSSIHSCVTLCSKQQVLEYLWLLNSHHEWVYKHMHGDKDTFLLAFSMAGRREMFSQVGGAGVWLVGVSCLCMWWRGAALLSSTLHVLLPAVVALLQLAVVFSFPTATAAAAVAVHMHISPGALLHARRHAGHPRTRTQVSPPGHGAEHTCRHVGGSNAGGWGWTRWQQWQRPSAIEQT